MQKIELNIAAIANSESQANGFVVILKENNGTRRLPVVIGGFEAQAIAIAIENIHPNRPMTHDLFKNTLAALKVELQEVVISDLKGGVFFATLICKKPDGKLLKMDSRTSDALALAVRFGCPIFANAEVLDEAGISLEGRSEEDISEESPKEPAISSASEKELGLLLDQALEAEDYEKAAKIRDELNKRFPN